MSEKTTQHRPRAEDLAADDATKAVDCVISVKTYVPEEDGRTVDTVLLGVILNLYGAVLRDGD